MLARQMGHFRSNAPKGLFSKRFFSSLLRSFFADSVPEGYSYKGTTEKPHQRSGPYYFQAEADIVANIAEKPQKSKLRVYAFYSFSVTLTGQLIFHAILLVSFSVVLQDSTRSSESFRKGFFLTMRTKNS